MILCIFSGNLKSFVSFELEIRRKAKAVMKRLYVCIDFHVRSKMCSSLEWMMYERCREGTPATHVIRKEEQLCSGEPGTSVRKRAFLSHRQHKRGGTQEKENVQKRSVA